MLILKRVKNALQDCRTRTECPGNVFSFFQFSVIIFHFYLRQKLKFFERKKSVKQKDHDLKVLFIEMDMAESRLI